MIQASLSMDFTAENVDSALLTLRSLVERIRAEAGCISCSVYVDTEMENRIIFSQKWRSDEALQRHLRSEEYQQVLLIMEMATTRPEIRFDTISETSGVEVIEKARTTKK